MLLPSACVSEKRHLEEEKVKESMQNPTSTLARCSPAFKEMILISQMLLELTGPVQRKVYGLKMHLERSVLGSPP